jgi:hypothetical protein
LPQAIPIKNFPPDYEERVYAGVLGKIIGVYLGRSFGQWKHEDIVAKLGEIHYYVHERRGVPLVVADDDISGTFTFIRALEDYGFVPNVTPKQIGQTWLNYLIENRTVVWWGGMSNSTEHTAYLRLKHGIEAPRSGAIETNGRIVAEQIGAQIFIDGWGMVCPGDPARAADFARRAGSVSDDGESVYGAQVIAAMEAAAFVEKDLGKLIDVGVAFIPKDSVVRRSIDELRAAPARSDDWHDGPALIREKYGYDKWPGGCHVVPNHAVVTLGLLWGGDDFQRAMLVTNTAGYDSDCNAANVGSILGIKNAWRDWMRRGSPIGVGRSPTACCCPPPTAATSPTTPPASRSGWSTPPAASRAISLGGPRAGRAIRSCCPVRFTDLPRIQPPSRAVRCGSATRHRATGSRGRSNSRTALWGPDASPAPRRRRSPPSSR